MNFRSLAIGLILSLVLGPQSLKAFVHISPSKPHLPVSPNNPTITFQWNGSAPVLSDKGDVFDGIYADSSDTELMEVLLKAAMGKWNEVESAYLNFEVVLNKNAVTNSEDEIYAIVVEDQDSQTVAAAALPSFQSSNPDDSPLKKNGHIIYDCDISVSTNAVSAKYLLKTLTHELGHCVGLGHPHSDYNSIMSYANSSDTAELGLDDKAGISFLYPEPGVSQKVKYMTSCGVLALRSDDDPRAEGGYRWPTLFLLLLPLLLGFRKQFL
ncbi:MAG: matrixin family metalloprotease [Chitinophagaceae bacterium]|nr:matrixin family metalloprotease [Oligoflexus sp.]